MYCLRLILLLTVISLISGCMTYRYGDRTFTDRSEAEKAYRADYKVILESISSRRTPLARYAKVVIPNKEIILERAVRGTNAEAKDYVATSLQYSYTSNYEFIHRRNIFAHIEFEETNNSIHETPKAGEVIIYLYIPDNKTVGWYYISGTTKRTPLHFDLGNPDKIGRTKYFIDSIEALASLEPKP